MKICVDDVVYYVAVDYVVVYYVVVYYVLFRRYFLKKLFRASPGKHDGDPRAA